MKKLLNILILSCLPCMLLAQVGKQEQDKVQKKDTTAKIIGAKVLKIGKPEKYKNSRQDYLNSIEEIRAERRDTNCDRKENKEWRTRLIAKYNESKDSEEKSFFIDALGRSSCPENMRFLEQVVLTDTCEHNRISAIQYMNGAQSKQSIPMLIKYSQKDLSPAEGSTLAATLIGMGESKHSLQLLQKYCFPTTLQNCSSCEYAYFTLGGDIAKTYFKKVLLTTNDETIRCRYAQRLAELGDSETSFPILKIFLNDEDEYGRSGALSGLAAIGTKECFDIIMDRYINDKSRIVRSRARDILEDTEVEAEVTEKKGEVIIKNNKKYKVDYEK